MKKVLMRACLWLLVLSFMIPAGGFAQDVETAPPIFRQEELDQMLAPIALYPDSLLVQVLMAATYPLEVVQAARWVNANPNLRADDMANALDKKNWDPSVKSLVNFPSILAMMNDKLEWTQDIGDAFLGQREWVMDTVQNLRAKAYTLGNLATTYEQVVVVEEDTIVIESASPQIIYVPVYNPTVVYGPWWYPAYPPYYYHPPGYAASRAGVVSFGVGLTAGVAWGYAWGNVNWNRNQVYVHPSRSVTVNNFYTGHGAGEWRRNPSHRNELSEWRHDPSHRKGVAYRDSGLRQQYGQTGNPGADPRKDLRGVDQGGQNRLGKPVDHPGGADQLGKPMNHSGGADRLGKPMNHPGGADQLGKPMNHSGGADQLGKPMNHPGGADQLGKPMNHPGGTDRPGKPVDRPGYEQQAVGIIHNRQPGETRKEAVGGEAAIHDRQAPDQRKDFLGKDNAEGSRPPDRGKDTFQRDRSTTMQNRPSGVIENINPGGGTVKQQSDRGRPNSENVPAQKPVQTIQGDKIGHGGVPNVSGGDRPGSGGVTPGAGGGDRSGGGGGIPNIGGGGLSGGSGQEGFRRQQ
jgi:hypothetical protein